MKDSESIVKHIYIPFFCRKTRKSGLEFSHCIGYQTKLFISLRNPNTGTQFNGLNDRGKKGKKQKEKETVHLPNLLKELC